jgi:hypothetical protein
MLWAIPTFTLPLCLRGLAIYRPSKNLMSLTGGNSGTRKINRLQLLLVAPSAWERKEIGESMVALYRTMPEAVAAVLVGDLLRTDMARHLADGILITGTEMVPAAIIDILLETYLLATKAIPGPRNSHAYLQHPIHHMILT